MKLYYHPVSTTSRIVWMFAEEEGIEIDYKTVDLMQGEQLQPTYKAINPNCLVPTLVDGDFRLSESGAIIRYLAAKSGSAAYPKDLKKRARVDEMIEWFYSNFYKDHGYGMIYPQLFPNHRRDSDEVQDATIAWGKDKAKHWLAILDKDLLGSDKQYLCGNDITIADYVGAELVTLGELIHCTYDDYPNVRRWLANMKALEHWPKVHDMFYGYAHSLKDKKFVAI